MISEEEHKQLAKMLYDGKTYAEISKVLNLSHDGARGRIKSIRKYLGADSRSQIIKRARNLGWL